MDMRAILSALLFATVALAGCAGGADDPAGGDGPAIAAGKGAISGLLVDDRFRPIQLVDDATSEFQAEGFVLLQETGEQVQTNENGEFTFVDIDPGEYTLRVTVSGHEATPQKARVAEGVFAETTIIARRVADVGSLTITEEYSVFVPCVFTFVVLTYSPDCTFDQSGETQRFAFYPNYTAYEDVSVMVTEMKLETPAGGTSGSWGVSVRDPGAVANGIYYSEGSLVTGDYLKLVNPRGEISEDGGRNTYWNNTIGFQVALFGQGVGQEEVFGEAGTWGVGPQVGQRAQFLVTLFLGEPELDIDTYCVLCE